MTQDCEYLYHSLNEAHEKIVEQEKQLEQCAERVRQSYEEQLNEEKASVAYLGEKLKNITSERNKDKMIASKMKKLIQDETLVLLVENLASLRSEMQLLEDQQLEMNIENKSGLWAMGQHSQEESQQIQVKIREISSKIQKIEDQLHRHEIQRSQEQNSKASLEKENQALKKCI